MSYILMKVLESSPSRYDRGITLITLGKLNEVYDRLASYIQEGWDVIDIGCGTGAMALRAAQRGARVTGIDVNPQMLEIAGKRVQEMGLSDRVELREQGVAELSSEPTAKYNAATSSLVLSELTADERVYILNQLRRLIKPGGLLLITDETVPSLLIKKILFWFIRVPLMILTFILTQTTTGAVRNPAEMVSDAGFIIDDIKYNWSGNLVELICKNPAGQE